jgi:hypothetical protein
LALGVPFKPQRRIVLAKVIKLLIVKSPYRVYRQYNGIHKLTISLLNKYTDCSRNIF